MNFINDTHIIFLAGLKVLIYLWPVVGAGLFFLSAEGKN